MEINNKNLTSISPPSSSSPPSSEPSKETGGVNYSESGIRGKKIKKVLKISLYILLPVYIFFHYFTYWDPGENCFITIKPAFLEFTNLDMKRALKALKFSSPDDYQKVCKNVSSVEPMIGCGGFGGGCFYNTERKGQNYGKREITVSTAKDDLLTAMAVILHETCHAIQEKEGRELGEVECYMEDDRLLRKIVAF
jgi:hypothetical protein